VSEENPTGAASAAPQLICAECGAKSPPDAAGWRAYLTDDDEAAAFCPECAAREFGGQ
jgi:rubrerythrin